MSVYDTGVDTSPYTDQGCYLAPACLSCPFPQCRHDDPRQMRRLANQQRAMLVRALRAQGLPVLEIAARLQVGRKTVWRAGKEGEAER